MKSILIFIAFLVSFLFTVLELTRIVFEPKLFLFWVTMSSVSLILFLLDSKSFGKR